MLSNRILTRYLIKYCFITRNTFLWFEIDTYSLNEAKKLLYLDENINEKEIEILDVNSFQIIN